eukprot:CAMPEP_0174256864 /NCGR_PEP_ID=MMETSP0439-20130205/6053_1 /TAXON_ID=0 /ORGANISM="Stereomyxa ramosa, Strain Chinc5" /LENGTH=457 /DNA_ID=CAMNT_0015339669 /DNA_START=143 /DNA_END=1516 /DNA_ORIENTATION=-
MVTLKEFKKFANTTEALSATTAIVEGKMDKNLKNFLKDSILKNELGDKLAVADAKLGGAIKEKLGIPCVHNKIVDEIMRGIRAQMDDLISPDVGNMKPMYLGLSHSFSRFKIKFSPDKVDVMIVQAISLLDDLDKELNVYAMRVKEWYGWHFPEMGKIVTDNYVYARAAKRMGFRKNAVQTDFSDILPEEVEEELKSTAILSMGTEISEDDVAHIQALCDRVIDIHEYREQLYEYLKNRMQAIAPNLTVMVGELVGARLIARAGSLMNLAKYPASTVQILGAEKALFRALKTKHETPKYGLIYHASLVGQAAPRNKGKISRLVASRSALACRVDALGENVTTDIGIEGRAKVEARMRSIESGNVYRVGRGSGVQKPTKKYDRKAATNGAVSYNPESDSTIAEKKKKRKRKADTSTVKEEEKPKKKKRKVKKEKAPKTETKKPKTPKKKKKKRKKSTH